MTKRVLDLFFAGTALVILSPLLVLICIGIKLEGRSPALLQRRRVAFNGREFFVYTFTTTALEDESNCHTRSIKSLTRVGRLLQIGRTNELPLLFSVLRGQMSLVGPSPHAVGSESGFSNPILHKLEGDITPGIIGWAEVNGVSRATLPVDKMNRWIELECWYINNWSIWLDLRILLRAFVWPAR